MCVNVSHDSFSNEFSLVDKVLYRYPDTHSCETTMYSQIVCPVCRNWTDAHNFCIRCGSRIGYNPTMTQTSLALPYQPHAPIIQQGLGYPQMQPPTQPYGQYFNWNMPGANLMQMLQAYQPPVYQASMPMAPPPYVHMQMMRERMGLISRSRF
jgi:hypothetical protein